MNFSIQLNSYFPLKTIYFIFNSIFECKQRKNPNFTKNHFEAKCSIFATKFFVLTDEPKISFPFSSKKNWTNPTDLADPDADDDALDDSLAVETEVRAGDGVVAELKW